MVVNGEIVICLMMYLVLFYDYWIVDGKGVVIFFVCVKEVFEDLCCLLMDL